MNESTGTLESIALALAKVLNPLTDRFQTGRIRVLFAELGLQFPPELESKTGFINTLQATLSSAQVLPSNISALISAIEADDAGQAVQKGIALITSVKDLVTGIDGVADALKSVGSLPGITPAQLNQFATELPKKLLDFLIVTNLEEVRGLVEALEFIGAIERTDVTAGDLTYTERKLHLDKLFDFIGGPRNQLKTLYQWDSPAFDGSLLLGKIDQLLARAGVPAIYDTSTGTPTLDIVFLEAKPRLDLAPKGLAIQIAETFELDTSTPFEQDDWKIELITDASLGVSTEVILQPGARVTFIPPSGQVQGKSLLRWTAGDANGDPYVVFGQPGGSRLEVRQLVAEAGVGFAWNSATGKAEGDFDVLAQVKGGKLVIDFSQSDGFLQSILSGIGLESDFDLGVGFSSDDGLYFVGSSTLEIQLPAHLSLGPIDIDALTFSIGISNGSFPIGLSANIKANLGPLVGVVEGIGVKADLTITADNSGNMGPLDLSIGFLPPKGVGLSIDAGVVKGGGYLFLDFENEEYAGALELVFSEFLTLKAIGLITTRMPDGSKGFSLLVVITAEFGSGLQLGFGFTLLAVGGIVGLNRRMNLQPLVDGVRTGAIESVMFPQDVIENAPRIISDLRNFFPTAQGIFLIGPMAKIGWGTPTLISLSLGIIFEIPGNIAILGVLKVALPTDEAALIKLQVNFVGAIEFDKERAYFFAAMFESRVLFMTIEGEMGVLIAWGKDSNFVVSVGGFHPQFNPPPLPFPSPKRISLDILNASYGRIRVAGYFAVTSNTAQMGARAELFFGFSAFKIEGHIGFDALFQFNPFFFIFEISAGVSLKVFGIGLFSISLRFSLEGPAPWRAKGYGKLKLLFFSIKANFDFTWGEAENTSLPPIPVMPLLVGEVNKLDNWTASVPAANTLSVTLRALPEGNTSVVLHPIGTLTVTQRALPLDITLSKIGSQKPNDANRFSIGVATGLAKVRDTEESFAIAQFQDFKDAEKLSKPAFQPEHGGLELAPADRAFQSGRVTERNVRYETTIIDTQFRRFKILFFEFAGSLFSLFLKGNAVSQSVVSNKYKKQLQPFDEKISVASDPYVVAFTSTNAAYNGQAFFSSEASAREFMNQEFSKDPALADALHVIPHYEMNPAPTRLAA